MNAHCLMLGAGFALPTRRLTSPGSTDESHTRWKTLDVNAACKPDEIFDLQQLEEGKGLPFSDNSFDEIHAYEILEHFGRQGDYVGLFSTFRALWNSLKPRGLLVGTCPSMNSKWLWAEPGHIRVIAHGTLSFLEKEHYDQLGKTACTDYRAFVDPCWWKIEHSEDDGNNFAFALRKIL